MIDFSKNYRTLIKLVQRGSFTMADLEKELGEEARCSLISPTQSVKEFLEYLVRTDIISYNEDSRMFSKD